jgi:hypothetical protein
MQYGHRKLHRSVTDIRRSLRERLNLSTITLLFCPFDFGLWGSFCQGFRRAPGRDAPMAYPVLFVRGKLGHRHVHPRYEEHGIISESVETARFGDDHAFAGARMELGRLTGPRQRDDASETG